MQEGATITSSHHHNDTPILSALPFTSTAHDSTTQHSACNWPTDAHAQNLACCRGSGMMAFVARSRCERAATLQLVWIFWHASGTLLVPAQLLAPHTRWPHGQPSTAPQPSPRCRASVVPSGCALGGPWLRGGPWLCCRPARVVLGAGARVAASVCTNKHTCGTMLPHTSACRFAKHAWLFVVDGSIVAVSLLHASAAVRPLDGPGLGCQGIINARTRPGWSARNRFKWPLMPCVCVHVTVTIVTHKQHSMRDSAA